MYPGIFDRELWKVDSEVNQIKDFLQLKKTYVILKNTGMRKLFHANICPPRDWLSPYGQAGQLPTAVKDRIID